MAACPAYCMINKAIQRVMPAARPQESQQHKACQMLPPTSDHGNCILSALLYACSHSGFNQQRSLEEGMRAGRADMGYACLPTCEKNWTCPLSRPKKRCWWKKACVSASVAGLVMMYHWICCLQPHNAAHTTTAVIKLAPRPDDDMDTEQTTACP